MGGGGAGKGQPTWKKARKCDTRTRQNMSRSLVHPTARLAGSKAVGYSEV